MKCYICHRKLTKSNTHFYYKRMCKKCGEYNWVRREELVDLRGYNALVTGGRIKIGYETALKLLRSGAYVVVTTRFPVDAVQRYSRERDFCEWYERLKVYRIDFVQLQELFILSEYLYNSLEHLDILINNAAQTIKHDEDYYRTLLNREKNDFERLDQTLKNLIVNNDKGKVISTSNNWLNQLVPLATLEPRDKESIKNISFKQEDLYLYNDVQTREKNSWTKKAGEISLTELLEVQLINNTAPFVLCTNLRSLLENSPHHYRYIINVSAMEGQFSKENKNAFHPHTNMAKASLNMFTRTSAQDYLNSNILMNSVDTGWITDENPDWLRIKNEKKGLLPPLDAKDGASRLCDPIFQTITNDRIIYGSFLKDYMYTEW